MAENNIEKNIENNIKTTREIKKSSLMTYLSALKTIKKKLEPGEPVSLDNTDFIQDFDKVMTHINLETKITSKKNKLTAILVALNSDTPKNQPLIDKYGKELKDLGEKYMTFLKNQTKTDAQKKNWLSYEELVTIVNKIMAEVKFREITKKAELSNKEFDILQQLLVLRTYLAFPLRNDFADMKVMTSKAFKGLSDKDKDEINFLIISPNNKKSFHINQFKNKKFIGSKILEVPSKLNRVINLWLKHNKSGWYLVKTDRKEPMNPNSITKFLNKIFLKYSNKKISTSMIRHIVISHLLKDEPTIKEQDKEKENIENTFLHTKEMNQLYRKVDREDGSDLAE
jgi:hypothetical protein